MPFYKILWDDNIWRATVCNTADEATLVLGAHPEVTQQGPLAHEAGTDALWAAPGTLFVRNVEVFPPAWVPALEAGVSDAAPEAHATP